MNSASVRIDAGRLVGRDDNPDARAVDCSRSSDVCRAGEDAAVDDPPALRTMVRCMARAMRVSIASCSTTAPAPRFIPYTMSVVAQPSRITAAVRTALSHLEPL